MSGATTPSVPDNGTEELYGFFSYPQANASFFERIPVGDEVRTMSEEGGCLFTVDSRFIAGLRQILEDPQNLGRHVFVEISGDDEHIFTNQTHDSVMGFVVLPDLSREECIALAEKIRRFESTFLSHVIPFESFRQTFQIRSLN